MFPFVTCPPWNPFGGECHYKCTYCWAKVFAERFQMVKYRGPSRIVEKELQRKFKPNDFVFVQDMNDLFGNWVPNECLAEVFFTIRGFPETRFLLLTKNPKRYFELLGAIPKNCVLGATVESNLDYSFVSRAPKQCERLYQMLKISTDKPSQSLFLSIEPILDFDLEVFLEAIIAIGPWAVAVGMDNYNNRLPEPPLKKTLALIEKLEQNGIKVYRKTLRKAWNET